MTALVRGCQALYALASSLALCACTDATYGLPDLPDDWKGATHVERLGQSGCGSSPLGTQAAKDSITVSASDGTIAIDYQNADFRCDQDVEAYVRTTDNTLDVLVQPINLNPPLLAGNCECQYQLAITLPGSKHDHYPAGEYSVNVFRRWDNINHPNDPVAIGTQQVQVP